VGGLGVAHAAARGAVDGGVVGAGADDGGGGLVLVVLAEEAGGDLLVAVDQLLAGFSDVLGAVVAALEVGVVEAGVGGVDLADLGVWSGGARGHGGPVGSVAVVVHS